MNEEQIKESLMSSSWEFNRLLKEHHECEGKLHKIQAHPHKTDQDMLEESTLKKKKLHIKDQINSMILQFRSSLKHQTA